MNAVQTFDIRHVPRPNERFEDIVDILEAFPNLTQIKMPWATLDCKNRPEDIAAPLEITITLSRNCYVPQIDLSPCDTQKQIAKQFPEDWNVSVQYELGVINKCFLDPKWSGSLPRSKFDLVHALQTLDQVLGQSIPSLRISAPIPLSAVGEYHRASLAKKQIPTREYDILTDGYDLTALIELAQATKGTIDRLLLLPHINFEVDLTLYALLCEFDWSAFQGVKTLDITVQPPFPIRGRPVKECSPFSTPNTSARPLDSIWEGHYINLQSLTIRIHWISDSEDAFAHHPLVMSDLAPALLAVGGPLCSYDIGFAQFDGRSAMVVEQALASWLTASLKGEINKLLATKTVPRWRKGGKRKRETISTSHVNRGMAEGAKALEESRGGVAGRRQSYGQVMASNVWSVHRSVFGIRVQLESRQTPIDNEVV